MRIEERAGKLVYDIRTHGPDGAIRERRNAPDGIRSPSALKRWAETRQSYLARNGADEAEAPPAPTLAAFGRRWLKEHGKAEGLKASTQATYERHLRLHIWPAIGSLRLDEIGPAEIQRVKLRLARLEAKSRANILATLGNVLSAAERWDEIAKAPKVELPRVPKAEMEFYDFEEWETLLGGAAKAGPMVVCALLLGGDAGLRRGELVALEQSDCRGGRVHVLRSEWEGHVGSTKSGRARYVPCSPRLAAAIEDVRHLRGRRLLWQASGAPCGVTTLQSWLETACRRAGLPESRNIHKLRHTFGAHLAMRGAPAKAIQELMGHADLTTTMKYMHLAKGSLDAAVALLGVGAGRERNQKPG